MKKFITFIITASLFILSVSCKKDGSNSILSNSWEIQKIEWNKSDPIDLKNADPNWNWYEKDSTGAGLYYDLYSSAVNRKMTAQLPYFSKEGSAAANLFRGGACDDYKKEYGWVLLLRDFGSSERAPKIPFYMLYNKARGIMRLFYYLPPDGNNYTLSTVELTFANNPSANLAFNDPERMTLDNYKGMNFNSDSSDNPVVTSVSGGGSSGQWSYADFNLSYDSYLKDDSIFTFIIKGVTKTSGSIKIDGRMELEQYVASGGSIDFFGALGTILDGGKSAINTYKGADEGIMSLNKLLSSMGINPIPDGPVGVISGIAAGISFIDSMISGFSTKHPTPLKFNGTLSMTGSITLETPVVLSQFQVAVPGSKQNGIYGYQPLYNKPLGVFALKSSPTMFQQRKSVDIDSNYYYDYAFAKPLPEIMINNHIMDNDNGFSFTILPVEASIKLTSDEADYAYMQSRIDKYNKYMSPYDLFKTFSLWEGCRRVRFTEYTEQAPSKLQDNYVNLSVRVSIQNASNQTAQVIKSFKVLSNKYSSSYYEMQKHFSDWCDPRPCASYSCPNVGKCNSKCSDIKCPGGIGG